MDEKEEKFLTEALLTNPITGEKMEITKVEGAESGKEHLQITVEGISGAFVHEIRTTEI